MSTKQEHIEDDRSCWNKAADHEELFILLGRDPAAPEAVMAWVRERIRLGLNKPDDAQILSAKQWAARMYVA